MTRHIPHGIYQSNTGVAYSDRPARTSRTYVVQDAEKMARAKRLTVAREARGLNKAQLARRMGLKEGSTYRYEVGERGLNRDACERAAKVLGVNVAWLWTGDGPMVAGAKGSTNEQDPPARVPPVVVDYLASASGGPISLKERVALLALVQIEPATTQSDLHAFLGAYRAKQGEPIRPKESGSGPRARSVTPGGGPKAR
jgi:transcriptional regulator with XRE-family HTH domain